jgi:hypothetical protein
MSHELTESGTIEAGLTGGRASGSRCDSQHPGIKVVGRREVQLHAIVANHDS